MLASSLAPILVIHPQHNQAMGSLQILKLGMEHNHLQDMGPVMEHLKLRNLYLVNQLMGSPNSHLQPKEAMHSLLLCNQVILSHHPVMVLHPLQDMLLPLHRMVQHHRQHSQVMGASSHHTTVRMLVVIASLLCILLMAMQLQLLKLFHLMQLRKPHPRVNVSWGNASPVLNYLLMLVLIGFLSGLSFQKLSLWFN